ncbi:helix-turn-helix transcriptional regulator [Couchioplanes caeruleus]|uniref:DNA-binding transcriptional regulator YafY n=2 Tax=Couchioplanes caeruleus TaxID=56438 RepID=A0A1K0FE10_9ACTN|nr:WYL domain-containing protein [Couchioplanes caeruleus]OJF11079.1 hypothetical protein BG844_28460 [Couchioplanes caeruleus subsp. caeruleus]ROP33702.1 putative DNA-binding transcriptional regulator YafY [Couchioplanes caeruleus]
MNRIDRLYALVEELRAVAPRKRTATWLAARFEVSVRTVERDLSALAQAGVPIYADRGRGGGYTLDRSRTLPPINITPAEATAAAMALQRLAGTPFHAAAHSLLDKLLAVMPSTEVAHAETLARRVQIMGEPGRTPVPRAISEALNSGRVLRLSYIDRHGRTSSRLVEPVGYIDLGGVWYLRAHCRLRGARRFFRLDRIGAATSTGEAAPPVDVHQSLLDIPGVPAVRVTLGEAARSVTGRAA